MFSALALTLALQSTAGFEAIENGRHEEALALFEASLDESPEDPEAHFGRGLAFAALGRSDEAVGAFRRVLAISPYHRRARFRLGNLLLRSGRAEEAERLLQGYESYRRWDHEVQLLRSIVASGDLDADDERSKTLALVRLLLDGAALSEASATLEQLEGADSDPDVAAATARLRLLEGNLAEAEEALAPALALATPHPEALWTSARVHRGLGRREAALAAYERARASWNDPPARFLHEAGTALAVNGRLDEAVSVLESAVARAPGLAQAQTDLALALATLGRGAEAEAHYREALAILPGLIAAQQGLASVLLERGETAEAVSLSRQSVEQRPDDAVLRRNLAFALYRAGKEDEAASELETAAALEKSR